MRRTYFTLLVILFAVSLFAKGVTQQGIAYFYDYKTKSKRPIANVQLTVAYAEPATSATDGKFVLEFKDRSMGDKISHSKQPYYLGMTVFNKKAVDEWSIRKTPLQLIMCELEELELAKETYYQQGRKAAKADYDKQVAKIKADSRLKEGEMRTQLQEASEAYQKLMETLRESTEDMARIDQSELDSTMQGILDLFEQGQVSEAIEKLKALRLAEKFDKQTEIRDNANQNIQVIVTQMKAAVPTLKANGQWEVAGKYLKRIADELNTSDEVFDYAYFCAEQNRHQEAISYYQKAIEINDQRDDQFNEDYMSRKSTLLNNLANLYSDTQRFAEAEEMYKQALEIRQRLAKDNPKAYEPDVAQTLNNLANLYSDTQRFAEAEEMYKQALEIRQRLAKDNPMAYEPDVALTLNNLAILYSDTQRFAEAEEMYKQALEIQQRIAKDNPKAYEPYVAITLNNLAILYYEIQRFTEAEEMYKQALEIRQRIAKDNPKAYEPYLAMTLIGLAALYKNIQRFTEAENMYKQALEIRQRIAKDNPKAYEPDVAATLNNLAILYSDTQRFTEAEEMYKQALEIRQRIAKDNPKAYEPDVAQTLGNLSFYAIYMKKYSEAEQLACEGLAVDSTQHWIASNLAAAILLQGRYTEAEPIYRQYKDELKDSFLDDFEQFKAAGVIPKEREEDVEKIKRMLEE